ncbi:MAG: spirocyclase AveC family protein, partial [Actinomycetota bacterium]|nr:spirocyclase AveC family protein [Actinomycetota bacterium]
NVLTDGVPRLAEPLWGVQNWPVVFGTAFLVVAAVVMTPFIVQSIRQRRLNQGLMVFACVMAMSLLDPIANWVSFTVYDPRLLHFPSTWTWMRFSPSVEPVLVVPGYPFYYFTIALISFGFGQRYVLSRLQPGSWWRAHPRTTLFAVGFGIATLWDIPTELLMIRANMYAYSQSFGPRIEWGGSHAGLPLIWSLYTILSIAAITPFLHRDDDGGSLLTSLAARLPKRPKAGRANQPSGQSAGRQILAGSITLCAIYLVITAGYFVIRVSGVAENAPAHGWPYGEIKTYDPYGVLEADGIPGPYYE